MSMTNFLNPPLFPEPDKIYLPMAEFHAGDDAKLKADACGKFGLTRRPFVVSLHLL
jgi:hypothetical protein